MWSRLRPPLFVVAAALLVLIGLLGTLQYRWLGQITEADRDRRRAMLAAGAAGFAQDIDRELTHAYLLFQAEPAGSTRELAERFGVRYDRWQASSRFPRLLRDFYVFLAHAGQVPRLLRFDPQTRTLGASEWPAAMANWREHFAPDVGESAPSGTVIIRRMASPLWAEVPAVVTPMSMLLLADRPADQRITPHLSYTIATVDLEYLTSELLPALAARHFAGADSSLAYQVAVFNAEPRLVFRSDPDFAPAPDAPADLTREFFRIRTQEFRELVSEVHRFTALAVPRAREAAPEPAGRPPVPQERRSFSVLVQSDGASGLPPEIGARAAALGARVLPRAAPPWVLVLKHPSGSLDVAVNATRRRNLIISSSILAILGASMGLLVLSTRRAQRLARQQMEFVAAVSHELRTPLAVIRSAGENLADGVVQDEAQIRKYGELVRGEGRRLTEMVEQILEFSGIESGGRGFARRPVEIEPLVREIVSASGALIDAAGMTVDLAMPADLPPVLGDEPALRRLFENLVSNAIKYGAAGGWIGVSAERRGSLVRVVVADRGMGIPAPEQPRVFEPFYRAAAVVAAQIQGAGLGLSLVQRIAESHGGSVSVKSAPGAGSEFIVQLPTAGEERSPGEVQQVDGREALERGTTG